MLWINFLHLYQPANADAVHIKEATDLSYLRIIRALEEHPNLKFTLNISGCLVLRWKNLKMTDLLERIKKLTNIKLNLWSFNPFEVTYFKAGFLGVKPKFKEKEIYSLGGIRKQLNYQCLRLMAMIKNPRYFNKSLWDTLSGEYYRSLAEKKDCYHIFDYWLWDEKIVESTLDSYNWERAEDTNATWRVGDGTAALYNYIYFTVAGFTEHDTFRSNQIREGEITRERALKLIEEENRPRFQSLRWYFNILEIDFNSTIKKINKIPKLYN